MSQPVTTWIQLIFAILCIGIWPNLFKLAGLKWRFELFSIDFAIGALLLALLAAFTLGNLGTELGFSDEMMVAGTRLQAYAVIAGAVVAVGTIFYLASIALMGLSNASLLTFGILGCIQVLTHFRRNELLLTTASGLILLVAAVMAIISARTKRMSAAGPTPPVAVASQSIRGMESAKPPKPIARSTKGVITGVLAGAAYAGVLPILKLVQPEQHGVGGVGPYGALLMMGIGGLATTLPLAFFFMNVSLEGGRISYPAYLLGTFRLHLIGILSGAASAAAGLTLYISYVSETAPQVSPRDEWMALFVGELLILVSGIIFWQKTTTPAAKMKTSLGTALFAVGAAVFLYALKA